MELNFSKLFDEKKSTNKKSTSNFFDEMDAKIAQLQKDGIEVVDFGVGDPAKTEGVPEFVREATAKGALARQFSGYPGNRGNSEFRNTVSEYLKEEFGIDADPETEINITNGSKTAVSIFPRLFVEPGDIVIVPAPGYPGFHQGTLLANGTPYFVPLKEENDFLVDFEAIPEEIAQKAKMIWINYPNSPTGKSAPREWLEKLVNWCHKHNIILASDEAYIDVYYTDERPLSPLNITKEGVVAFYSFSKRNNMTGYRAGFAVGDSKIIEKFYKLKNMHDDGVPDFVQDGAVAALKNTQYLDDLRKNYKEKRRVIIEAMMKLGCEEPKYSDGSIFLLIKAPEGMTGEEFSIKLIEKGIAVIPASNFTSHAGFEKDYMKDFVRFALMPSLENTKKAMERL